MPYGSEEIDKELMNQFKYPLPKSFSVNFISRNDIPGKILSDEEALKWSILKWEKVLEALKQFKNSDKPDRRVHHLYNWISYDSCALCLKAIEEIKEEKGGLKTKGEKCNRCKLSKIDKCIDENSTFWQIEKGISEAYYSSEFKPRGADLVDKLMTLVKKILKNLAKIQESLD